MRRHQSVPSRLAALVVAIHVLLSTAVCAYMILPESDPMSLGTHQWIARTAVQVLRRADYHKEANFFEPYLDDLARGAEGADTSGGTFSLMGKKVARNSMSHFYNPETKEGFRATPPYETGIVAKLGIPDGYMAMVLGPGMPSSSGCDWKYEEARQEWRKGTAANSDALKKSAMQALGFSQHFVADATVPQHATDCGDEQGDKCRHKDYEKYVQREWIEQQPDNEGADLPEKIEYDTAWAPSDYVTSAARTSSKLIDDARSGDTDRMKKTANQMIPLALRMVAGLYKRFYDQWASEEAGVVLVRIDRVQEREGFVCKEECVKRNLFFKCMKRETVCKRSYTGNVENGIISLINRADFQPEVTIGGQATEIRGYTVGVEDVRPRSKYDANGWTFARRVLESTVDVKICIWNINGLMDEERELIDVAGGSGGNKCLHLTHTLGSTKTHTATGCNDSTNRECIKAADIEVTISSLFPIEDPK